MKKYGRSLRRKTGKNFWRHIKKSQEENETPKEQIEELIALLSDKSEEELVAFEINLRKQLKKLNQSSIIALCAILENKPKIEGKRVKFEKKPSQNGFLYFRCWLILQGQNVVDTVLENIEKLVDTDVNIETIKASGLLDASLFAFSDNEEDKTIKKSG
ncbi:MAG: DUF4240 domain-containing protein [Saprospiraceae bacterium]|nr:DUF4240 domain-containing protein [Saprospiraceae bacterium]